MEINPVQRSQILISRGKTPAGQEKIKKIIADFAREKEKPELSEREMVKLEEIFIDADNGDKNYTDEEIIEAEKFTKIVILIRNLYKWDSKLRQASEDDLVKIGTPVMPFLIKELKENRTAAFEVGEILAEIGQPAVAPLVELIYHKNEDTRRNAAKALEKLFWKPRDEKEKIYFLIAQGNWDELVKIGEPAVAPLTETLKYRNFFVSRDIIETLGKIKSKKAVPALIEFLEDKSLRDWDHYVAVEALGNILDERAVPILVKILSENKEFFSCHNAKEALIKIGQPAVAPLIEKLNDTNCRAIPEICEILEKIGDQTAAPSLREILKNSKNNRHPREAVRALGKLRDKQDRQLFVEILKDKDAYVRGAAAFALDNLKWQPENELEKIYYLIALKDGDELFKIGQPAIQPLIEIADQTIDPSFEDLMKIFAKIGGKNAVQFLSRTINDKNRHIADRLAAVRALGEIKDLEVAQILIEALSSDDLLIRSEAENTLTKIGLPVGLPLIEKFKDQKFSGRQHIIEVLGKINNPSTLQVLREALMDEDLYVCRAAAEALDKYQWQPTLREEAYYLTAKEKWDALIKIGEPAVEPLIRLLQKGSDLDREDISPILIKIGQPAVAPLIEKLKDKNSEVRALAAKILGEVRNKQAVSPLVEILKDEDREVSFAAIKALGEISDQQAIRPLLELLKESDRALCEATVRSLEKLGWQPQSESEKIYYLMAKNNWDELVKIGQPVIPFLKKGLGFDLETDISILKTLQKLGEPNVTETLQQYEQIVELRWNAWGSVTMNSTAANSKLGKIKSHHAMNALVMNLYADYYRDPGSAARALVNFKDQYHDFVVRVLIKALSHESRDYGFSESLHSGVCWALGEIGDKKALSPLIQELLGVNKRDIGGRISAATALGKIADSQAVKPLISVLKDDNIELRETAIVALKSLGPLAKEALTKLKEIAQNDKEESIRRIAQEAIVKIEGK